mgnify:CR=1 FL=1
MALLADTKIPIDQREAALADVVKAADDAAVEKLTAVVLAKSYFTPAAIEGLGRIDKPGVEPLLVRNLDAQDSQIVAASLRSLGRLRGSAAIDRIAKTMAPDGAIVLGAAETIIGLTESLRSVQGERGIYEPTGVSAERAAQQVAVG